MDRVVGVVPGAGWYLRRPEDREKYDAMDDRVICFVVTEHGEAFPVIAGQPGEPVALAELGDANDNRQLIHESER
ncbi:hypothetical protein [Streptomyces sp. HUAS ZL42]|uniref:hypothetical protein n=1 Tax=Streptomyces sp. HUAS ZL42 TaxID=3231715 RepID=UPI00345E183D